MLTAETDVTLNDAAEIVAQVCGHLVEHGASHRPEGDSHVVTFPFGIARMAVAGDRLNLRVEARDLTGLHYLRMATAGHLLEFAPPPGPAIVWRGDAADMVTPPNFRLIRVLSVQDITPLMRRIRFAASALDGFDDKDNLHVTLVIPPPGQPPEWPVVRSDGLIRWPGGAARPDLRLYTIRRIDPAAGWFDVDFVIHPDAGPGSAFAGRCRPGDVIGMTGPGGGGAPLDRDFYLLAGDETALPAMARILGSLPGTARGTALIEVADGSERQPVCAPPGIAVRWLSRKAGETLHQAVAGLPPPPPEGSFVWVGCEHADFRMIRALVRDAWHLPKRAHLVVSYWRKGFAEG